MDDKDIVQLYQALPIGTPVEIVRAIAASDIEFDKCIQEGTWVHISFDPAMRKELLIANFAAGQPTTYTQGVA